MVPDLSIGDGHEYTEQGVFREVDAPSGPAQRWAAFELSRPKRRSREIDYLGGTRAAAALMEASGCAHSRPVKDPG
jgi:hypothetical protein